MKQVVQRNNFFIDGLCMTSVYTATTAPNADVAPVHDRMPVALAPREANAWLGPGFGRLADRSALKLVAHPEPDHLGRVARGHNGG